MSVIIQEVKCRLCLTYIGPQSSVRLPLAEVKHIRTMISVMFQDKIQLVEQEVKLIGSCPNCFQRLTDFYDYYRFVLENQKYFYSPIRVKQEPPIEITVKLDPVSTTEEPPPKPPTEIEATFIKIEPSGEVVVQPTKKTSKTAVKSNKNPIQKSPLVKNQTTMVKRTPKVSEPATKKAQTKKKQRDRYEITLINKYLVMACNICPEQPVFDDYRLLREHITKWHKKVLQMRCCGRPFVRRFELGRHFRQKHLRNGEVLIPSSHYLFAFDPAEIETEREEIINKHYIFTCHFCEDNTVYPGYQEVIWHMERRHPSENIFFGCCNRNFNNRHALFDHTINTHHDTEEKLVLGPPIQFDCDECGAEFPDGRKLNHHKIHTHNVCKNCGMDFLKAEYGLPDVWSHQQQHLLSQDPTKVVPFLCAHCDKQFLTRQTVLNHLRECHPEINIKTAEFICDLCGKEFLTNKQMLQHQRYYHPEGSYKIPCHVCGMMIRNNDGAMRRHLDNAHNPKPTECPECGMVSTTKRASREHFKRMHMVRKHQCKQCSKRFFSNQRLIEHEATHTGINLYYCDLCESRYKSYSNLHKHKRQTHPEVHEIEKKMRRDKKFQP